MMKSIKAVPGKRIPRSLVVERLERVSKELFKKYYPEITELIGNSPGVYALYDEGNLYYVGKSIDLKKRVKQHLKDRHLASWTDFSLYLVRNSDHIHEIEELLVRIANPSGNRVVPKGRSRGVLLKQLEAKVKQKQQAERARMFGHKKPARAKAERKSNTSTLEGLVARNTPLFRTYKGKDYKAVLTARGVIRYAGTAFDAPSAAAHAVTKGHVNGWSFWYFKDDNGDWLPLNRLRAT